MKKNKGITMIVLVITIALLLILAGISIQSGGNIIKRADLENLKTDMLLIKVKGKEYVENANFKLGTNFKDSKDRENRIITAKAELKKGTEMTEGEILEQNIGITQGDIKNTDYTYYYKLSNDDLTDMGLSNVKSDEKNGWYIIKYDLENVEVEVYNTLGYERDGNKYFSLTELQNLNIEF